MNLLEYIKELKSFLVNESISGSSADEIYEKTNSLNAIKERLTSLINEAQNAGIEFSAIQEGAQNAISSISIPSAETSEPPNSEADNDIDSDAESSGEIPNSVPDADAGADANAGADVGTDEVSPPNDEPKPESDGEITNSEPKSETVPPREPLIHIPIEPKRPPQSMNGNADTESGGEIPNSVPDADAGADTGTDEIPPPINEPKPENETVPPRKPLIHIPIEPKRPRESASQGSHRPRKFTKPTEIDDLSTPGNTNADTIKMNYDNQLEDDVWSKTEPKIPNKTTVSYNFGASDDNARSYGTGSTNSKTSRWEYKNSSAKGIKNRTKRK